MIVFLVVCDFLYHSGSGVRPLCYLFGCGVPYRLGGLPRSLPFRLKLQLTIADSYASGSCEPAACWLHCSRPVGKPFLSLAYVFPTTHTLHVHSFWFPALDELSSGPIQNHSVSDCNTFFPLMPCSACVLRALLLTLQHDKRLASDFTRARVLLAFWCSFSFPAFRVDCTSVWIVQLIIHLLLHGKGRTNTSKKPANTTS